MLLLLFLDFERFFKSSFSTDDIFELMFSFCPRINLFYGISLKVLFSLVLNPLLRPIGLYYISLFRPPDGVSN